MNKLYITLISILLVVSACGHKKIINEAPAASDPQTQPSTPPTSLVGYNPDSELVDTTGAFIGYIVCETDGGATYFTTQSAVHVPQSKYCPTTTTTVPSVGLGAK